MKKFSFLLMGAFLLGTITFALAEETKEVETATGTTAEAVAETTAVEATEAATGDTAEAVAETTAAEATEAATGDTVEAVAETTAAEATEATTGDTAEATAETATPAEETTEEAAPTISDAAKEKYGEEQIAAYEWALENGITTINDVEKANLLGGLTRAQLAKMMSQYMTNVLGKTPAETEKVEYADVNESLGDLADFIQTAYAYKIMGINADGTPIKNFNPNGKVTRAEYATVFSRVLFGDKYNKAEGNYYENHLNALKDAEILTNTTPTIQEVRGWVMLMMYRSSQNGEAIERVANATVTEETSPAEESTTAEEETATEEATGATIGMPNPAAVYCEEQGGTVSIVKDEEGNESGMCKLADGTEVDEWEYYRANHSTEEATGDTASLYSEEDLAAAEAVINNYFENEMTVKVEDIKISYLGDEKATSELSYCKEFEEKAGITIDECAVFSTDFYIPEQDAEMAGAFEPNKTITGYEWYLGRTKGGEWKILTLGY